MKILKLGVGALVLAGCAKFPNTGDTSNFTRITFRMKVAGKINTTADEDPTTYYIYDVALRATDQLNPQDLLAPQPVVNSDNPNGRVAGSPTNFIEFDSLNPFSAEPFVNYRFSTQAEVPNPSDPTNPINLGSFLRSTRGRIINYQNLDENPQELKFDIYINQLSDTDALAPTLNTLMVNFLTMSRLSTGAGGTRIIDSIGDNRSPSQFNSYIKIDLRQNGIYGNSQPGIYQNIEPTGDTYPGVEIPDLDIIDWSIEVNRGG